MRRHQPACIAWDTAQASKTLASCAMKTAVTVTCVVLFMYYELRPEHNVCYELPGTSKYISRCAQPKHGSCHRGRGMTCQGFTPPAAAHRSHNCGDANACLALHIDCRLQKKTKRQTHTHTHSPHRYIVGRRKQGGRPASRRLVRLDRRGAPQCLPAMLIRASVHPSRVTCVATTSHFNIAGENDSIKLSVMQQK